MMLYMNTQKLTSDLKTIGLAFKAGKLVFGEKAILQEISHMKLIFLAQDAGANITKKIKDKCEYYHIPLRHDLDKEALSKAISKSVTVLGIKDKGFRDLLL